MTNYRAYAAEFLGTATLTGAVLVSLTGNLAVATPIAAALTVMLFVYTIGPISGAHINPAVTIALLSVKKIKLPEAALYILAQMLGAAVALFIIGQADISVPTLTAANSLSVALAEAVGAFFLMFGISSVVYGKVSDVVSGIVVGGSLLLGISLAMSFSNGVLNPAVAVGIGSASATYLLAPLAGTIAGAHVYKWMVGK